MICGATSGYNLDFDVRYLWMRQKQIIGSHFANAYECMRANQLMAEGKIRPVLWKAMGFDGVAEAHQLLHENKHLGKISILVGAEAEEEGKNEEARARSGPRSAPERRRCPRSAYIDWHVAPFRADRWLEVWQPARGRGRRPSAPALVR